MDIAIQNSEYSQLGGISTYSNRLCRYLNQLKDVNARQFIMRCRGEPDLISIQYEPGCTPPQMLNHFLNEYMCPIVVTAHHTLQLEQFYPLLDGVVIHDETQLKEKPWSYTTIPHPALVYPKKDKKKLRKKYRLPQDKKIIGTMGFICGTGKTLPLTVHKILSELNDDEYLYLTTSFWKGGDFGRLAQIEKVVKDMGKESQFRIDTEFVIDEEILNERLQCCDLLFAWNNITQYNPGSQSGSAADMYGSRVKLVVKDCPHYSFIGKQDKVVVGRPDVDDFVKDVIDTLRNKDLSDVQDPTFLSWEEKIKDYYSYFLEVCDL